MRCCTRKLLRIMRSFFRCSAQNKTGLPEARRRRQSVSQPCHCEERSDVGRKGAPPVAGSSDRSGWAGTCLCTNEVQGKGLVLTRKSVLLAVRSCGYCLHGVRIAAASSKPRNDRRCTMVGSMLTPGRPSAGFPTPAGSCRRGTAPGTDCRNNPGSPADGAWSRPAGW